MDNSTLSSSSNRLDVRRLIGTYLIVVIVLTAITQIITALRGPKIDLIDGIALLPVAIAFAAFQRFYRVSLGRIRFGGFVTHALTFGVVNGSYHLVAFVRVIRSNADTEFIPLDGSWFGPLIAMCGIWAIGLVLHGASVVATRGFED